MTKNAEADSPRQTQQTAQMGHRARHGDGDFRGAAVSLNMGLSLLASRFRCWLALFNLRLGWWLGNPGKNGCETYHNRRSEMGGQTVIL